MAVAVNTAGREEEEKTFAGAFFYSAPKRFTRLPVARARFCHAGQVNDRGFITVEATHAWLLARTSPADVDGEAALRHENRLTPVFESLYSADETFHQTDHLRYGYGERIVQCGMPARIVLGFISEIGRDGKAPAISASGTSGTSPSCDW